MFFPCPRCGEKFCFYPERNEHLENCTGDLPSSGEPFPPSLSEAFDAPSSVAFSEFTRSAAPSPETGSASPEAPFEFTRSAAPSPEAEAERSSASKRKRLSFPPSSSKKTKRSSECPKCPWNKHGRGLYMHGSAHHRGHFPCPYAGCRALRNTKNAFSLSFHLRSHHKDDEAADAARDAAANQPWGLHIDRSRFMPDTESATDTEAEDTDAEAEGDKSDKTDKKSKS